MKKSSNAAQKLAGDIQESAKEVNINTSVAKNLAKLPLILATIMLISSFLPWLSIKSSGSFQGLETSYGLDIGGGVGLWPALYSIIALILIFIRNKFSFVPGLLALIYGVYSLIGTMMLAKGNISGSFRDVSISSSTSPSYGVFIYLIASLLFTIATIKYLKKWA